MFRRKCKLILIRHGATIYSEQGRLYDSEEYPPLNQHGRTETELLSNWLLNKTPHVDAIYSSSALRAVQSARIFSKAYDLDYKVIDSLCERRVGIWGGLTFEQIEKQYPEMLLEYHKNPYEYCPQGGENRQHLKERVSTIITKIVNDNEYKTIIIVTHEGVIQSVVASILNIPPENQGKICIATGSATQINFYSDWATLAYCGNVPQ